MTLPRERRVLWRYHNENDFRGAPVALGNTLWQLTVSDLIAVNAETGVREAHIETADSSPNAGVSSDGRALYCGLS